MAVCRRPRKGNGRSPRGSKTATVRLTMVEGFLVHHNAHNTRAKLRTSIVDLRHESCGKSAFWASAKRGFDSSAEQRKFAVHNELSWPHLVLSLASARHFVLTIERLAPHPRTPSPSGRLHLQRQSTRWRCPPQRPPAPMQHQMAMQQEVEIIIRGIRIANTQSSRRQW